MCRIWLEVQENEDLDNPLVSPWKCTGSMRNVHIECLKVWIQNKRNTRVFPHVRSFNWRDLRWELCKNLFSDEFYYKSKKYKLLEYEEPKFKNYLVLESFTHTYNKTIHIWEFEDDLLHTFIVGRSSNVEVRITDISVSRQHSNITFENNNFYIKDLNSKFGTVVRLWHPISIPNEAKFNVKFQIGKNYIEIESTNSRLNKKSQIL